MHFAEVFTAMMALPAMSMAAAIFPRQSGFKPCSNFNPLSVGVLYVNTVNLQTFDSVDVQIRVPDSGEAGWRTIQSIPKGGIGTIGGTVDVAKNPGIWNVRICDSRPYPVGGFCLYPDGVNKLWKFMASGDRWPFSVALQDTGRAGEGGIIFEAANCLVADGKVTDTPTVTVTATPTPTTTSKVSSPPTTTSTSSTRTTSTNTRVTSSTNTNTRTSSTSRATSTSTRRN